MVKIVDFLHRKDDISHEEFVERWRGKHGELAEQLPGLQYYSTSVPTDPEKAEHDGVLELGFEDMAALGAAFDSEIGQEVQADAEEFVDVGVGPRMIVEESVHVDEQ
ncbi:EthD family reductase [Halovenus salina]|uniref:EthD family reductase n=1 Tax=Halovenus salina TaxID=1510225 RepID=A0ABD5W1B8_9EURY|nr:EthD family reductase [Halovenus salina]